MSEEEHTHIEGDADTSQDAELDSGGELVADAEFVTINGFMYRKPIPARYKQLANGVLYDLEAGKFAANPVGGVSTAITKETSPLMHEARRAQTLEAIEDALVAEAGSVRAGIGNMAVAMYRLVNKADGADPRYAMAAVRGYEKILQSGGYWEQNKGNQGANQAAFTITIAQEAAIEIAKMYAERLRGGNG